MSQLHVLRVFVGPDGRGGNPLGVFLDGREIEPGDRQRIALELGFPETVFVDAVGDEQARIRIFTPAQELGFAGHPTVGTSWQLREAGTPVSWLACPAGMVDTWHDAERTWIRARPEWVHPLAVRRLVDAAAVEALAPSDITEPSSYVWAWIDEPAGTLRSRYFASGLGIVEDEATGAAAVFMGGLLGRELTIRQGVGSELLVRPGEDGTVEVGGRVELTDIRDYPWPHTQPGGRVRERPADPIDRARLPRRTGAAT